MRRHSVDYIILFCVLVFTIAGLITLSSASSDIGRIKFGDSYYYLKHQLFYGFSLGLIGFIAGLFFYYRSYQKFALFFLAASIILLLLVFTPLGFTSGGATRWVSLGASTFQPSEVVKILFILYMAAWLLKKPGLVPFLAVNGVITVLLLAQPSTSAAIILMASVFIMYFVSGIPLRSIIALCVVGAVGASLLFIFSDYRRQRIVSFLNPERYEQTSAFHLTQALTAIGSGGWFGVGYGQSRIKYSSLPETIGDSIFAVFAEEWGFTGAVVLISFFFLFVYQVFAVAKKTSDNFGKLLLVGFSSLIGIQAFVNMAAISGLIPLTGVPLPFISYGGTALASYLTMAGIILNVSRYAR